MRIDRQTTRGRALRALTIGLLLLGAAAWAGFSFAAEMAAQDQKEAIANGRVTYRVYCRNCHGDEAVGDGQLAELLTTQPADLTQLTAKYEGKFPEDWLVRVIDGRERVRGHGMQEMPVWGLSFRDPEDPGDQEAEIQRKLTQLVAFLRSIQEQPGG